VGVNLFSSLHVTAFVSQFERRTPRIELRIEVSLLKNIFKKNQISYGKIQYMAGMFFVWSVSVWLISPQTQDAGTGIQVCSLFFSRRD